MQGERRNALQESKASNDRQQYYVFWLNSEDNTALRCQRLTTLRASNKRAIRNTASGRSAAYGLVLCRLRVMPCVDDAQMAVRHAA
jgi:hypothetical protein